MLQNITGLSGDFAVVDVNRDLWTGQAYVRLPGNHECTDAIAAVRSNQLQVDPFVLHEAFAHCDIYWSEQLGTDHLGDFQLVQRLRMDRRNVDGCAKSEAEQDPGHNQHLAAPCHSVSATASLPDLDVLCENLNHERPALGSAGTSRAGRDRYQTMDLGEKLNVIALLGIAWQIKWLALIV